VGPRYYVVGCDIICVPTRTFASVPEPMDEAEFDRFADEYRTLHAASVRLSGESPEFFAEYKVADVAALLGGRVSDEPAILDFGAGVGTSVPYFRKHLPRCRLTCLDVSRRSLEVGRAHFGNEAEFVHFDGPRAPFADASFDVVFFACVLHHVAHSEHPALLAEAHRVLRPDGSLVVFEHNPYNPLTVYAVNTSPLDANAVLLTPSSLRRSAERAGFPSGVLRYCIFFPSALRSLRPLERRLHWLPLGAQYSYHARRGS
jgi:SAM-dependent methyltransferase